MKFQWHLIITRLIIHVYISLKYSHKMIHNLPWREVWSIFYVICYNRTCYNKFQLKLPNRYVFQIYINKNQSISIKNKKCLYLYQTMWTLSISQGLMTQYEDRIHVCINILSYRKTSNIRGTSVGNNIVDHSDVVGALPVGAAATTSSFST